MKRITAGFLTILVLCTCTACGKETVQTDNDASTPVRAESRDIDTRENEVSENVDDKLTGENNSNILVAYFSRTGNTEALAEQIGEHTGGDLFEIEAEEPYPDDYDETVERFRRERDENARPAVANSVEDMMRYDIIFVGFPNWGDDMPHVVYTFLEQYDFSGKTLIPFCTNGGGGFGDSITGLERTCPDSMIAEGFECNGRNVEDETGAVAEWLATLGLEE